MLAMPLTPLAPAARPAGSGPRWSVAASTLLHLAAVALIVGIAARPRPPGEGAPSYDLVFESPATQPDTVKPPGLPPIQPADIAVPDDAPLGLPAQPPTVPPIADGVSTPPIVQPQTPVETAATSPPASAADRPEPAFAPPSELASTRPPLPSPPVPAESALSEPLPDASLPTVNLQWSSADQPRPSLDLTPIMPLPPAPLPRAVPSPPAPPRPQPAPQPVARPALGTFSNPMDLNFSPAPPRPAARGSVASRAIDLSPPPERQGPLRSDPYAQIRVANASEDWQRRLLQYWLRHRFYPQQAAESGEQGTVTIQLTVDRSGRVEDVQVLSRSGSQWLDLAAVSTWRNARLPPFTNEMRQERLIFPVPITYYLVRR